MWSQLFLLPILLSVVIAVKRGGGSHSYPSSHGRSGTGSGTHTYPQSNGRSGTGMGSGTHTYPQSHGHSGTGSGYGTNTYPQSHGPTGVGGAHTYPQQTSVSSNTHVQRTYTQQHNYVQKTEVHHHYHYNPPQQITYGSTYHPVYHGPPPVYVYEYRNSGSRFDSLLTGLALYNLGRMSANHNYNSQREYRSSSNEICKLGISKPNGEYEETRIDCKLMSSFIWEAQSLPTNQQVSTKTVTTTVVQSATNSAGTLTNIGSINNSPVITTTTVQEKTVVDALQVKGPSIQVTNGMTCFMIRISRDSSILKKNVECGLLQAYAQNSLYYRNNTNVMTPSSSILVLFVIYITRFH